MTEHKFVESIRQDYSGLPDRPRDSLASIIKLLADDLNAKDAHFIFELIQNAEDNDYSPGTPPRLRFEVCQQEVGGELGPVLIVHNNEIGFQEKHVGALCKVGDSTKSKAQDHIGEKGIGFKSVFRITKCPYIFSNGFQFCLPEHDEETGLGYIVPRWVADPLAGVAGTETTIILPINRGEDVVQTVVDALRDIAPETILFLERLESIEISVHLPEDDYEVMIEKRIQAVNGESKQVELTYLKHNGVDGEVLESSLYWVTEVEFPKPAHVRHEKRDGIESRTVSVAIPLGPDAHGGKLFAYLPVWEDTGLPFLINADFLLVGSREGIHENEAWNKWLCDCIAETYGEAFLSLLNAAALPVETKIWAYASIPLESHRPFLARVVQPIQESLKGQECVLVLPERFLAMPSRARLCYENFRAVLGSSDSFPRYLREDARLVCSEIETFRGQLEAIGVQPFLLSEVEPCLEDTAWVQGHDLPWFIDLLRFLSGQKFESMSLRKRAIIPIGHAEQGALRLSCDAEQPIYFSCTEADREALARVPGWLSELVPVAFLDPDFLSLIDRQADQEGIRKWLKDALNAWNFTIQNYCVDISSKLRQIYGDLGESQLIEATAFLAQHAGANFDWEGLPIILSDGRRMLLQEARRGVQAVVVPDTYNPEAGWQHIWQTPSDRKHLVWLARVYTKKAIERLIADGAIEEYPPPRKSTWRHDSRTVTEVNEDYLRPDTKPVNGKALVDWLRARRHEETIWPADADMQDFVGEKHSIDWACDKTYYQQGGSTYRIRTGHYRFKCQASSFLEWLRNTPWLPTTKGPVRPSQAFPAKQGIREVLGDAVPYFEGNLSGNIQSLLGIRSDVTVEDLLALLKDISRSAGADQDLTERIYAQLHARTRYYAYPVSTRFRFADEALILVKDSQQKAQWRKSGDCIWEDASAVLGDDFAYLSVQYPQLHDFFVDRLGVKERVDPESYAQRWLRLQNAPLSGVEKQRALIEQIYREIKPIVLKPEAERPPWWPSFARSLKIYTQSDTFEPPNRVILPDDGVYREKFQERVAYAWRPTKESFNEWAVFYQAFGTPLLSQASA